MKLLGRGVLFVRFPDVEWSPRCHCSTARYSVGCAARYGSGRRPFAPSWLPISLYFYLFILRLNVPGFCSGRDVTRTRWTEPAHAASRREAGKQKTVTLDRIPEEPTEERNRRALQQQLLLGVVPRRPRPLEAIANGSGYGELNTILAVIPPRPRQTHHAHSPPTWHPDEALVACTAPERIPLPRPALIGGPDHPDKRAPGHFTPRRSLALQLSPLIPIPPHPRQSA